MKLAHGRRIASNAGYLAALTLSNYALGLLVFPYLSRVLSVEAFGVFGFAMSYVLIFQVIVEFGFMISATARIARSRDNPSELGKIVSRVTFAKIMLSILSALILAISALAFSVVSSHLLVISLFWLSATLGASLPDYYFRGMERMRSIAIRAVSARLVALVLVILVVHGDEQLALAPLSFAAGNAVAVGFGYLAIHKSGIRFSMVSWGSVLSELRDSSQFFAARVASSINQSAGSFVLGLSFSPASVPMGQFSGALRLSSAGELAVIPVSDALYPHMVNTRDYRLFWRVYGVGLAIWLAGCAGVFFSAEHICVIILGPPFAAAGPILQILAIGTFFAYSGNMFGYVALAPLGLAHHANIAVVVGAGVGAIALLGFAMTSTVNVITVAIASVISSFTIALYRLMTLLFHRSRWLHPST